MRALRMSVVLALVVGFTPGAGELLIDAAHFLLEGHTAHDEAHADHGGPGPEHGCTGWHHTCPCHTSVSFATVSEPAVLAPPAGPVVRHVDATGRGPQGVSSTLERPPRA